MLPRLKSLTVRCLPLAAAALLALGVFHGARAADAPADIPLRIGEHANYTRFVFDFPRLTAYSAEQDGDDVVLVFDSPSGIAKRADAFRFVSAFKAEKPDPATLKVTVTLPKGETWKDYRIVDKVILDVHAKPEEKPAPPKVAAAEKPKPAPKPEPAKAAPKPEPVKTAAAEKPAEAPKPVETKTAAAPPPAPAPAPASAPAPTPEKTAAAAAVPAAPPAPPAAPAAAQEPEEQPTRITVSTIEPTRLAVFARYGTLWVVLDSEAAGAVPPAVSGPQAEALGAPKVVRFKGGTAFRYAMPQGYLSVAKQDQTWRIQISSEPQQRPARSQINANYDVATGKTSLMAEIRDSSDPLEIEDPATGDTLLVVAAMQQGQRVDEERRFANVEIIPAAIGMAVRPLADDVRVHRIEDFMVVTSPRGIIATQGAGPGIEDAGAAPATAQTRLFDFRDWRRGGTKKLYRNRREIEDRIAATEDQPQLRQDLLMKLALLYFANDFGQETLGVLRIVADDYPDAAQNPNFIALRGAASAMAGHYQDALKDLTDPLLQQNAEVNLWIGYAAAASEQWRMANRSFPADDRLLATYPEDISIPFTIYMAESALRLGHTDSADALLESLDSMSADFDAHDKAAIAYLKGEAAHQAGNDEEAIRQWTPVAFGLDQLYHTKAALALADLNLKDKKITLKQAIDDVDSLRFAWRGDGLEVHILQYLGDLKVRDGQYLDGLQDMKRAADLADEILDDSAPIRTDMSDVLSDLFVDGKARQIPALDAASIYTEFSAMMPQGQQGMKATLNFADSLIDLSLLDKAEALLEDELKGGDVPAAEKPRLGAKLAAIYLLDRVPAKALSALDESDYSGAPDGLKEKRLLLRARALSQLNRTDEAVTALAAASTPDAERLRADVLWRAHRWDAAAAAIETMLPAAGKAVSDADAQMIINAATAYLLAGDAGGIDQLKSRYGASIAAMPDFADTFAVLTRKGGATALADRTTMLKRADEVDLFKGFLDSYKAAKTP